MTKNITILFLSLFIRSAFANSQNCPTIAENYGDHKSFQNIGCRIMVVSDETNSQTNRNIIVNPEGMLQVFNNFPGTTNSNSTGARVYFLLPYRNNENNISSYNENGLTIKHRSGVTLNFDKNGRLSSPDINIKVDSNINSKNKGGIEIQKYNNGLIIDLGWRMGNSPTQNPNAQVKVTDKKGEVCTFLNSDLHTINKFGATLKYKTNDTFHAFLSKKCPGLDISDLKNPNLNILSAKKINKNTLPPASNDNLSVDDSARNKSKDVDIKKLFEGVNSSSNISK